jgi:hypothetical protein
MLISPRLGKPQVRNPTRAAECVNERPRQLEDDQEVANNSQMNVGSIGPRNRAPAS